LEYEKRFHTAWTHNGLGQVQVGAPVATALGIGRFSILE
jgi:hypothetical protein